MKRITTLISLIMLLCVSKASAQVIADSATVGIFPYFQKKDTLIYNRENFKQTINGTDTTTTHHTIERYMVICKKANDKKGYTIEETPLEVQVLHKDPRGEMADKMNEFLTKAFVGMKVEYTIDPEGKNLEIVNQNKVIKDATSRLGSAWDSITTVMPLFKNFFPKEAAMSMMKGMISNPNMLMQNFEEISQLFEFHGDIYELDKEENTEIKKEDNPLYTQDAKVKYKATADPEEGKTVSDWDDYTYTIESKEYWDATKYALAKMQETGQNVTEEQLKMLLKDKMPKGEMERDEVYENHYFGDGWPKECTHVIYTKQLESGIENIEGHHLEWESRSTGNK